MRGIDVSQWQGVIDWSKVKATGIDFVYIKSTEGTGIIDPNHIANFKGASAVGLPIGWYHFGHPNQNAVVEADFLVNVIKPLGYGKLPIILDIEVTDNVQDVDDWALAFLNHVAMITHHEVGWYSGTWFDETYLKKTTATYPFGWDAQYSTTAPAVKWMIWQQSQTGHINGIQGNVDIDEGVSSILGTAPQYALYDVVVKDKVFSALAYQNNTYILWSALEVFNTPHTYKGNGVFEINGKTVQGVVYEGNTYIPWFELAPGIKPINIHWAFEV